jgi:hypothetical protein
MIKQLLVYLTLAVSLPATALALEGVECLRAMK